METFTTAYAKLLYLRFCAIYGDKFVKGYHDEDFKSIWYAEWSTGLTGIDISVVKGVLETCKLTLEWPPSIAEFRRLCEEASGMPSLNLCLDAAIRRDFHHPVVKLAFDKVGSWEMKNGKDEALRKKFDTAYREAIVVFRADPVSTWAQLEEFKKLPPPVELPSKIPTAEECLGFKERMKKYTEMAASEKAKLKPTDHPVWDAAAINVHSSQFDQKLYEERRKYLLGMDETLAMTLSPSDQYDRIRLIREDIAHEHVKSLQDGTYVPPKTKASPRSFNGGKVVYKNWMGD